MDERGGVDHLDHGGHADQRGAGFGEELAAEEDEDGAQAFAAAGLEILTDVSNGVGGGDRFKSDFTLDFIEVCTDEIEDL